MHVCIYCFYNFININILWFAIFSWLSDWDFVDENGFECAKEVAERSSLITADGIRSEYQIINSNIVAKEIFLQSYANKNGKVIILLIYIYRYIYAFA